MHISVNGQRIFFDVVSAGLSPVGAAMREKPALIVLHGGPGFDHANMRPEFDCFADVAQVIYLDHRGNGRSHPSDPATWTLDQWADDIAAFCDALGIVRPIIFGQSFGGMVAQAYAVRHPGHAGGVIFSSTAARMNLPAILDAFARLGGGNARDIAERFWTRGDDAAIADYMRVCMPLYNTRPRAGGEEAAQRVIRRMEVFRHFSLPGREMWRMDFRAALAGVTVPALVLSGDSDPVTPAVCSQEIFDALPGGHKALHVFEKTGHGAYRDAPERVFPVVRGFVEAMAG
ncbi:MAG TPA: alpha/beta fold hydrolase [Micropepsaceae bacterium]|nr:alpha/beta fold hydrolase [Micropepsaceae bacterium]